MWGWDPTRHPLYFIYTPFVCHIYKVARLNPPRIPVHTRTYTHTNTHPCTHKRTLTCIHTHTHTHTYTRTRAHTHIHTHTHGPETCRGSGNNYGLATISRLLKIIGLSCKRDLYKSLYLQERPIILRSLLIVATP